MTPFRIADNQVIVPEGTHPAIKKRISRGLWVAQGLPCGVQLEPLSSTDYAMILHWLRERNFPSMLLEDYDTLFFSHEHDLTLFLLTWANCHSSVE